MKRFEIDPTKGPDAAEDLPDEEFARLLQIVTWKLAMRTSREQLDDQIRHIAMQRSEAEQKLVLAQTAREQRRFAAEVMNDISQLPTMGEPRSNNVRSLSKKDER